MWISPWSDRTELALWRNSLRSCLLTKVGHVKCCCLDRGIYCSGVLASHLLYRLFALPLQWGKLNCILSKSLGGESSSLSVPK
jgi:hypothetical protein